ncbi:MAG: hypothetical protein ACE5E7_10855 [Anaerolineae bacterium]
MPNGKQKLRRDLVVLEAMASEMEAYLKSEVLFWPMGSGGMPRLTLGGYLMREHRLLALEELLTPAEVTRLHAAVDQFNQALVERIVRFEQRGHQELEARLRQWGETLKDIQWEKSAAIASYGSSVETRVIIRDIVNRLEMAPYKLEGIVAQQLTLLDANLHLRWQPGEFVWPVEWKPAYPQAEYWWLYGRPK